MKSRHYFHLRQFSILALFTLLMGSCVSYKETIYFRDKSQSELTLESINGKISNLQPIRVRTSDVLVINIYTYDPTRSIPFNPPAIQRGVGIQTANAFNSYLVDSAGEVKLPVLGSVKLEGLTVDEAEKRIKSRLEKFVKDPTVNVQIANIRITVLGEVNRPGVFTPDNDRVSILEAIGMANDITSYGNRQRVLVIREESGQRKSVYLDLQSTEIFSSPFFYMRQGDIIYVEPIPDKEAVIRDKFTEAIPWVTSVLSAVVTVLSIINLTRNN